ncbi:MAG TPA: SpoIIE family protein phosphatase [Anaerolineales bacterium]|nr:SpoIIE family protein phosphatase [Anaerolineales bacterium]
MTNPKVLIVDDEPFNVDYLEQELEELDYETVSAANGREALDRVECESPDLILLDIMMPIMDGFEVLSRLKADPTTRNVPVIVISAHNDLQSMARGIQLGAEDYLPKPFNPVLLQARIGASLEKKHLRDKEQLYLKSLERELEIGREIQAGFLPKTLPKASGWEIAASLKSAKEVAGDFYDAFYLASEQKICVAIADVCDKGVGAALFMTLFRSLLRFTIGVTDTFGNHSPAARLNYAISHTNSYIATTHGETGMFATMFFGMLDPLTGQLSYINAGHESPLVVNSRGECIPLKRTGPAVGVFADMTFTVSEVQLQAGELFFAFTDGAPDALDPMGNSFGRERLKFLLNSNTSAQTLLANISVQLSEYIAEAEQFDDITLFAIRRLVHSK